MNELHCERLREELPEHVAGVLPPAEAEAVERHLAVCPACRAEAELLVLLRRGRPSVPAGLAQRIRGDVRFARRAVFRPMWGLAAAAVAVLAIGIGIEASRHEPGRVAVPAYATDLGTSDVWLTGNGVVAGAPVLEGLSNQALEDLLKEMGQWKSGT